MANIDAALEASKDAMAQLIATGERTGARWAVPPVPGKWSPSQIVEHVARTFEESANVAEGNGSKFPQLPGFLRPVARSLLFRRVLKKGGFPRAKTNKAMDPVSGPPTPAEGRARLETAYQRFDEACRKVASRGEAMRTGTFGAVPMEDYVRFIELHTRHHEKQIDA